jgi:parallel beta-helix repeat protein
MNKTLRFHLILLFCMVVLTDVTHAQWVRTNAGAEMINVAVSTIAAGGTHLFAGTLGAGIFHSTDQGQTWEAANSGLTDLNVNVILRNGPRVFAGTRTKGVFISDDNGLSWAPFNVGLTNRDVRAFAFKGIDVFAGTGGSGIFRCGGDGIWTPVNNGLTVPYVDDLKVRGNKLFASNYEDNGGVFVSADNGGSWRMPSNKLLHRYVREMAVSGFHLFAATYYNGVYCSDDDGQDWKPVNNGMPGFFNTSLTAVGAHVFSGTDTSGVFQTDDYCRTWAPVAGDLFKTAGVTCLASDGSQLYAGTAASGVWRRPLAEMIPLEAADLLVTHTGDSGPGSLRQALTYANLYAGADTIRFAIPKSDEGFSVSGTWTIRPRSPLPYVTDGFLVIDGDSQTFFTGSDANSFGPEIEIDGSLTENADGLWINAPNVEVSHIAFTYFGLSGVVVNDGDFGWIRNCYFGTDPRGEKPAGNGGAGIYFAGDTRNFFVDTGHISGNGVSGILLSGNCSGIRISNSTVVGNAQEGINIASGCDSNEVSGNWIAGNGTAGVYLFESDMNTIANNYIGTNEDVAVVPGNGGIGLYLDHSAGNRVVINHIWDNVGDGIRLEGESAKSNRITQNSIWHNGGGGIRNTSGSNEGIVPPRLLSVSAGNVIGNTVPGRTVEIFTDDGSQGKIHLGTVTANASGEFSFSLAGQTLLDGITSTAIDSAGNTSDFSAAVKTEVPEAGDSNKPATFALYQNYPNPFNPRTRILYSVAGVPGSGGPAVLVSLKVYDRLGRLVSTLVNGSLRPGVHEADFDGSRLESGIYFYRIVAGGRTETRKMILLR